MPTDSEFINDSFRAQTPGLDDMDEANLPQHSVTSPKRTPGPSNQTSTNRTSKKQKSVECEEVRNTLDKVANAVIKLAESVNSLEGLISQVSKVVIAHPLIPEDIEMLVLNFLISNDKRAYSFLILNAEKQIKWLETDFYQGSSGHTP
ncbi:hypothetical protein AAC387_Pa05g1686 [Persea americana]